MLYTTLGTTSLKISRICLGSMNWGEQNTESDAHEQLDYSISVGINFIDTAEIYPIPPRKESQGSTETFIGSWLQKRKKRDDLIIASKVGGRGDLTYIRGGETPRFDRKNIRFAVEGSLKRLQTDYIDLYQLHWPDRETNYFGKRGYVHNSNDQSVPIEETLTALQELITEGKIRHIGVSNETAWGVMEFIRLHREKGLPRIQSIQNPYSLIMREYETALAEISIREQVSLLVYSPLSMGVLTGKYLNGAMPKGSRFDYTKRNLDRYNPPEAQEAIAAYVALAKKYKIDPAQMAISFVTRQPFVTSTIIGATSLPQLKADISAIDIHLPDELIAEMETIHKRLPNPIT